MFKIIVTVDGQTDMTTIIVACLNFVNVPTVSASKTENHLYFRIPQCAS
jgi:hypothetical protein